MTIHDSQAEPTVSVPAADTAVSGKPARKAPRRATAAAGAPAATAVHAPAMLVLDSNGMIVPQSAAPDSPAPSGHDAGHASLPLPAPPATGEAGEAEPGEAEPGEAGETEAGDSGEAEPGEAEPLPAPPEAEAVGSVQDDGTKADGETSAPEPGGEAVGLPSPGGTRDAEDTKPEVVDGAAGDSDEESVGPEEPPVHVREPAGAGDVETNEGESSEPEASDADVPEPAAGAPVDAVEVEAAAETAKAAPTHDGSEEPDELEEADAADELDEPAEAAEAAEAEPAENEPAPEAETAPISRRERRLAEQEASNGAGPADDKPAASPLSPAVDAVAAEVPSSTAATESTAVPKPRSTRNPITAFIRGLFVLLVISALVLSTGTVIANPDGAVDEQSPTLLQRQDAWEATVAMEAGALALADAASTPELRTALAGTAAQLGTQAEALSDGLPGDVSGTTPATAAAGAGAATSMTVAELIQGLKANSDTLLANAQTAEQAMGRVFASAGTGQILQASLLASVVGTAAPTSKFLPAQVDFPAPSGPQCTSTLEPRPGATIDAALKAAALAEQQAVYAYQVASTRFAEPQFSKSTALLSRHQQKLRVLNEELLLRCLPPAEPVAGYALDSSFTTMPKQALSVLESELSTAYADLAAYSPAAAGAAAGQPATATATVPAPADATPQPQDGTQLREVAVLWLLDSAHTHISWGGTIGALPGIPDQEPAPATPAG